MFSPLAFPAGMIVYDLTTSLPPQSHMVMSPFEFHREPLAIVAIADGEELGHVSYRDSTASNGSVTQRHDRHIRDLDQQLEDVRDQYPKALVHRLLIFDYIHTSNSALPDDLVAVPPNSSSNLTTIKTVMCDLSSKLLAEMTTLAKSLQVMTLIESPNKAQGAKSGNGYSWPASNVDPFSRRNSQISLPSQDSRSGSPIEKADRSHVRMSMPAQLRSTTSDPYGSTPSARPTTPMNGSSTLDEISRSSSKSPPSQDFSRITSTEKFRDHSRDRISVQGFGSGSISERSRNKGKGRYGIVLGTLYLQAGRWGDALREFSEGAAIAQSINDHLWHAKAMENIVISMLMLAWSDLDFQIPQLCYVSAEKAPYHTPPASALGQQAQSNRAATLQTLASLLPSLLEKILYIYERASNFSGEELPQLPFSETVIRFSKLLASLHLSGGQFTDKVLQQVVLGAPNSTDGPQLNVQPSRSVIASMLLRAFPWETATQDLSIIDRTIILGGIASVLDSLRYYRKKAMIMREIVGILIPGLIQARKIGAAEMGIHPAAGLAALNAANGSTNGAGALELSEGDVENGIDELLSLMGRLYGVVSFEISPTTFQNESQNKLDESDEATISRIMHNATMRAFGGQNVKMNVLRACINLAEALPDFQGVLRFSTDLLRTAGSGVAPGPRSDDASPSMPREEQIRLASNITRTVSAAKKLGLHNIEAEYWDEFLVRGVELEAQTTARTPVPHQKSELSGPTAVAESRERNPFIYNPFLKKPNATAADNMLVAEEKANFRVTLQNAYEIDVEIESIRLESDDVQFISDVQSTTIGPYRTQILTISGTPKSSGLLTIKGCYVKVRGCRERRFPIFTEPWAPRAGLKIKAIGLAARQGVSERPTSADSASLSPSSMIGAPKPTSLKVTVIDQQPIIVIKSTTLSQSAVMVLEGERQVFSITLQNLSNTTSADLLLFSFQDSTQAPLQTALSNREASPAELYEYELILARKQALRWVKHGDEIPNIEPGGTATFDFEILGKPGLTNAVVQVDYTHLGVSPSDAPAKFYTRQATLPLTITVNASVELVRMDVLSLAGEIPPYIWGRNGLSGTATGEEYCLLVLDLRNAWPSQLHVHLELEKGQEIDEDILPGNTSRIVVPTRRVFLEHPHASIPTLDPARQRQFVVSTGKISADSERATREAFWYREEILKTLQGTWETISGQRRRGSIELRGIRLGPRMIDAIKIEDVGIELSVDGSRITTTSEHKYQAFVDHFVHVKARITNRTSNSISPMLRIQPSLRNHSHSSSLDLTKKIVVDGTLQHAIPLLPANDSIEVTITMTALCRGEFEIGASVEEARLEDISDDSGTEKPAGRPRANTKTMMDSILGTQARRIWHTREPCIIVVEDEASSDEDA